MQNFIIILYISTDVLINPLEIKIYLKKKKIKFKLSIRLKLINKMYDISTFLFKSQIFNLKNNIFYYLHNVLFDFDRFFNILT